MAKLRRQRSFAGPQSDRRSRPQSGHSTRRMKSNLIRRRAFQNGANEGTTPSQSLRDRRISGRPRGATTTSRVEPFEFRRIVYRVIQSLTRRFHLIERTVCRRPDFGSEHAEGVARCLADVPCSPVDGGAHRRLERGPRAVKRLGVRVGMLGLVILRKRLKTGVVGKFSRDKNYPI